jgi:hypothetical protein
MSSVTTNTWHISYQWDERVFLQRHEATERSPMDGRVFISPKLVNDISCLKVPKFMWIQWLNKSRDSSIGIETGYGLDNQWVGVRHSGGKNCLFSESSRLALGSTQPPIQRVLEALSLGVKWQEREADRSPPASAEVKKMWIYTSTSPYAFMA